MGRTVIVGDVHGCSQELAGLLDRVGFRSGDRLVFVGDLVARGPDSRGVLDIARTTGAVIVRGNHEQKLIAWRAERQAWVRGEAEAKAPIGRMHRELARSLRRIDWTLLETSLVSLDLPEHGVRVVHAGVLPGLPFELQKASTLMSIRTVRKSGRASDKSGKSFCHLLHHLIRYLPVALGVALHAHRQRHVEEHSLHFVAKALRHLDPLLAFMRAQVCGIHIVPRHLRNQPRPQQAAQRTEDQPLVPLIGNVVKENRPQQVAGKRRDAPALVPGRLT